MGTLMQYVGVYIAHEEDADKVFGIRPAENNAAAGKINRDTDVERALCQRFGCGKVAVTLRESINANENNWSAMLYENGKSCSSPKYSMRIVDRVGGSDFFGGVLIYALQSGYTQTVGY